MSQSSQATPMLIQYQRLKSQNPHALLMFRLGDFYELFGDDAVTAAPLLEVQLTSRDGVVPMCGVPHHALSVYLQKLMDAGHTVAIAEQMEDPRAAKGLVERQVVRICSPGTYVPEDSAHIPRLAVVVRDREGWALAVAELSTGTVHLTGRAGHDSDRLLEEWARWRPDEYLTNWPDLVPKLSGREGEGGPWFPKPEASMERELAERLGTATLSAWGLDGNVRGWQALYAVFRYLEYSQRRRLTHLNAVRVYELEAGLRIPDRALRQIGVFSERGPDLYRHLNRTVTPMGARLLEYWLSRPLSDPAAIAARAERIRRWVDRPLERGSVRRLLRSAGDIPRRLARLALGLGTPKDLRQVLSGLDTARHIQPLLAEADVPWRGPDVNDPRFAPLYQGLAELVEDPPVKWDEGNLFQTGADERVDHLRRLVDRQKEALAELEQNERVRSGLRSLKIGYHRTFGYYWEIPRSQADAAPPDWRRRQTMTNRERYTSDALLALEAELLGAEEERKRLEQTRAEALVARTQAVADVLGQVCDALAELDVTMALAETASLAGYVWPELGAPQVELAGLRHPVLETVLEDFVPNDFALSEHIRVSIITGPNMGGKSTFMRAVAQCVVLAQIGMGVPAQSARLPLFDGIYTRIGADDDIFRGQSTFMVEMEEVAAIMRLAGPQSLVILDELGRGTATYDGMAIAHAVLEHLARPTSPLTLFATHYHELTRSAEDWETVTNWTVEVLLEGPRGLPVFTHRLLPGAASRSYGVEVARLAGLPAPVLARARALLRRFESDNPPAAQGVEQVTLFAPDPVAEEIISTLKTWDPNEITPKAAWEWVEAWHRRLNEEER